MKRAPLTYRRSDWNSDELARFRRIERNYHLRAFGEELARANLDLSLEERRRYLEWMRGCSRKNLSAVHPLAATERKEHKGRSWSDCFKRRR